jgi:rhodanese-related sulfurtransferase
MKRYGWIEALLLGGLLWGAPLQAAEQTPNLLEPAALQQMIRRGETPMLIDVMSHLECMDHSIPGSLCIAEEEFASKAPRLLPDRNRPLVFYGDSDLGERSRESATAAIQQGYGRVSILAGGLPAWKQAGHPTFSRERIPRVPVEAIKTEHLERWIAAHRDSLILDLRREARFKEGHLPGAINIPLYLLQERYPEIPLNRPVLVVDERGSRTFLAASYLVRKGIGDVKCLLGGMQMWQAQTAMAKKK